MNPHSSLTSRLSVWLDDRLPIAELKVLLSKKVAPQHKHAFWYFFGGLTLFFFGIQIITGILLSMYYKPTTDQAHESIRFITTEVQYGWLIRSLHAWSANLMIGTMFVHMFSVFLMKAYRKPRELMWISGVLLMFLVLGFGFTGYLLPWDTVAYFATLIGTEIPKTVPLIGDWGVSLLKGGEEVGGETLVRMYSIHIIVLPLMAVVLVSFHILLNLAFGSSVPLGIQDRKPPLPFFPNFLYRDLIAWCIGFVALVALAVVFPPSLGDKADPLASAPVGIKPEWYFLPLYQTLKFAPTSFIGVSGELAVNGLVGLAAALWLLIPFLDTRSTKGQTSRLFTAIGVILVLYLATTMAIAYAST
ncbi:MAG: cytochrome bc complex cytochrome b subunit [Bacteroidota bacterium]